MLTTSFPHRLGRLTTQIGSDAIRFALRSVPRTRYVALFAPHFNGHPRAADSHSDLFAPKTLRLLRPKQPPKQRLANRPTGAHTRAQKIEQPFLTAVKQTLDERCNETIEQIYKIAIKLIIETIADGYSRADSFAADAADLDADKAPASGACGGASGAAPGGVVGGGGGSSGRGKSDGTALSKSGAVNDNDNGNGNGNGTGNGGSFAAAAAGSCPVLASGGCKRP